jgi:WG containing repeat
MRKFSAFSSIILIGFCGLVSDVQATPRCTDEIKTVGTIPKRAVKTRHFKLDDGRAIDATGAIVPVIKNAIEKQISWTCAPYPERNASGQFGFKDENGAWLITAQFSSAEAFHEGRAVVELKSAGANLAHTCTYVSLNGQQLKNRFQTCSDFEYGIAFVVGLDDVSQIINRVGDPLIENTQSADWGHATASFSEGLIALFEQESGKVGYADAHGKWIIKPGFAQGFEFHEGLAAVTLEENGKVGFINKMGQLIIPIQFGEVSGEPPVFSEGLALVSRDGLSPHTNLDPPDHLGFIDTKGRWVIPPRFTSGKNFENGLAHVYSGDREYYIDRTGKIIWPRQKLRRQK